MGIKPLGLIPVFCIYTTYIPPIRNLPAIYTAFILILLSKSFAFWHNCRIFA